MIRRIIVANDGTVWSWKVLTRTVTRGKRPRWVQTSTGQITWTGITREKALAFIAVAFDANVADLVETQGDLRTAR